MLRLRPLTFDNDAMSNGDQDDYQPSVGAVHGFVGVTLFVLGGFALANTNENEVFGVLGPRGRRKRPLRDCRRGRRARHPACS